MKRIAGVIKRDGEKVPFQAKKIFVAVEQAGKATGEFSPERAESIRNEVLLELQQTFADKYPAVETIQDYVESALINGGYLETARAYIVYREKRRKARSDLQTLVNVETSMNEYLDRLDWRVQANANQGYSLGGLILNVSGKVVANYWLSHVYPQAVGEAHRNADLHIHDLDMLSGYCAGWSLRTLLNEGLNGVPGKIEAGPPKHLSSVVGQMVNFLGTLQNE
ncbi:MAG: ATP cone domain-containing protein, partial [Coriobacteriia bacterium]|nr:ATP cone domain-containing protein [Coriobacteriia bacterium]